MVKDHNKIKANIRKDVNLSVIYKELHKFFIYKLKHKRLSQDQKDRILNLIYEVSAYGFSDETDSLKNKAYYLLGL